MQPCEQMALEDRVLISIVLFKLLLADFIGLGGLFNGICVLLIVVRLASVQFRMGKASILLLLLTCSFPAIAFALDQSFMCYMKNYVRLVQVLTYVLYASYLINSQREALLGLLIRATDFLNVTLIVNYMVMHIQLIRPGLIVASHMGVEVMGVDMICGLFGYGSTHTVALFTVLVILANILRCFACPEKRTSRVIWIVFASVYTMVFSLFNDNKALWFFLPLALLAVLAVCFSRLSLDTKYRISVVGCLCVLFAVGLYVTVPMVRKAINLTVMDSVKTALRAMRPGAYALGSDERFKIITYAFLKPESWTVGDGIGAADFYQEGYCGFPHFGQSDFGSLVILTGFVGFLLIVSLNTLLLCSSNTSIQLKVILPSLMIVGAIYTQVFTQVRIAVPFLILLMILHAIDYLFEYRIKALADNGHAQDDKPAA